MLAFLAFEVDAKGLFEGEFDVAEDGEVVIFGAGAGLAGVRSEKPGDFFRLGEGDLEEQDATEEVGEEIVVFGVGRAVPEVVGGAGEDVLFADDG